MQKFTKKTKYKELIEKFLELKKKNHLMNARKFCEIEEIDYKSFLKSVNRSGTAIIRMPSSDFTILQFGISRELYDKIIKMNAEKKHKSIAETIRIQLQKSFETETTEWKP